MSDFEFEFGAVTSGYRGSVQRGAVLYPLMGMPKGPGGVRGKTTKLLGCWRARLHALAQHGWYPRSRSKGTQYVRNCPPPFVMTRPIARPCTLASFCPFCYARWAGEVWETIDAAFPNPRDTEEVAEEDGRSRPIALGETPPPVYPFHLVERHFEAQLKYTDGTQSISDYTREAIQSVIDRRSGPINAYKPLGAFHFTTVTTQEKQDDPGWLFHYRLLLLIRADQPTPVWEGSIRRITEPNRREVANAVIRTCKYPRALLYGDPELMVALLNAKRHPQRQSALRLSAMYGVFRKSNTR